jgi:3-deoxy-D-manno-octulosonate 8-phosphate phosphatase (KDO 8-P phosphatase)
MHTYYPQNLMPKLKNIKLLILDVDGVLTNGGLYYGAHGEYLKIFNSLDGHGLKMLMQAGVHVAIISGRGSAMLNQRMQDLGIADIYTNIKHKLPIYESLAQKYQLNFEHIAYMGDDLPDYALLKKSGLSVCPQNAHALIQQICDWCIHIEGGKGAVRLLCDAILLAQNANNIEYLLKQQEA